MRPPLHIPTIPTSRGEAWTAAGEMLSGLMTPTLRLGVTGLSRSGKTVLITALVRALISGGRLPFLAADAEGRIESASLEPHPDHGVPRFDYEANIAALAADPPDWPKGTRRISQLRLNVKFRSDSYLRRQLGARFLNIDIVDYPGEWLTDLAMLGQDYAAWSREALALSREPRRAAAANDWLAFVAALDPTARQNEQTALDGAKLFTRYLNAARDRETVSTLGPGRFIMPGDLEGSPLLTFFPLPITDGETPKRGSLAAMLAARYDSYRQKVVQPFFKEHFKRLDRQIVLVDVLSALNGGPEAVADLERALAGVLAVFRPGANAWYAPFIGQKRVDKLLFAATKADHLHHSSHDRLEAILRLMTNRAIERAETAGAGVEVMAVSALRATREAEAREGGEVLPCIVGVPLPGERLDAKVFDGREEVALFPGDLPVHPADALAQAKSGQVVLPTFLRFRPRRVLLPGPGGESPPAPHIRLDRALEYLIGDWLL